MNYIIIINYKNDTIILLNVKNRINRYIIKCKTNKM